MSVIDDGRNRVDRLIELYYRSIIVSFILICFTAITLIIHYSKVYSIFQQIGDFHVYNYIYFINNTSIININGNSIPNISGNNVPLTYLLIAFVGLIIYTYFYDTIRNKGALSFEKNFDIGTSVIKFGINVSSIYILYAIFGSLIVIIMSLYLFIKGAWIEIIFLLINLLSLTLQQSQSQHPIIVLFTFFFKMRKLFSKLAKIGQYNFLNFSFLLGAVIFLATDKICFILFRIILIFLSIQIQLQLQLQMDISDIYYFIYIKTKDFIVEN
jgi:hypothetical protein